VLMLAKHLAPQRTELSYGYHTGSMGQATF
jgi:hypothetical protein